MKDNNYKTLWYQFRNLIERGDKNSYPPFFFSYHKDLIDERIFTKRILNIHYLLQLSKKSIENLKVLDVGCGFGIDCVIMSAMGASEVHALDQNDLWIKTINNYLKELKWELPVIPKSGSASDLPYPDNFFDVIMSVEAVSHYSDVELFLNESQRVLKPSGTLIISDGNNGSNPFIRQKTYKIWERFENGPPTDNFHGHPIKKSFRDMRKEIISSKYPELKESEKIALIDNTFGMDADEIITSTETFIKDGNLSNRQFKYGKPAFNPVDHDYIERLFKPGILAKKLKNLGFKPRIFAHFGGAGSKNVISKINSVLRVMTPLSIYLARGYKLIAVKDKSNR
jgi:ubiquinone/menaquinone biosynthesis C-methylase UbiE